MLTCPIFFVGAVLVWLVTWPFDRRRVALHLYSSAWASFYVYICPLWRLRVVVGAGALPRPPGRGPRPTGALIERFVGLAIVGCRAVVRLKPVGQGYGRATLQSGPDDRVGQIHFGRGGEICQPVEHPAPPRLAELLRGGAAGASLTARPGWTFDPVTARAALLRHFRVATADGFGFDEHQPCLTAAGALLLYLQEACRSGLAHLRRPRPHRPDGFLVLDEVTRRSLELTRTLRDGGREGSLLSFLDRTATPMGARLLQESLLAPLTDRAAIEAIDIEDIKFHQ